MGKRRLSSLYVEGFWNKESFLSRSLFLYYIKQIDSMLPCVCSVKDPKRRQIVVRTSVTHSAIVFYFWRHLWSGAHHQEPGNYPYSCHGVYSDQSIYSLNLSRIQVPTGTSVTNCSHKHGLLLTCQHYVVLPKACSCRLELAYFAAKISKNILFCKNAVALAYYGSSRLLLMHACCDLLHWTAARQNGIYSEEHGQ